MLNHFDLIDSLLEASLKPLSPLKTRYLKKILAKNIALIATSKNFEK